MSDMTAIDARPGHYYVTVQDGARTGYLLGPYASHADALREVDRGNSLAYNADPRAHWYSFGTGRLRDGVAPVASVFGL
jgi:hypothetical protein